VRSTQKNRKVNSKPWNEHFYEKKIEPYSFLSDNVLSIYLDIYDQCTAFEFPVKKLELCIQVGGMLQKYAHNR